MLTLFVATLLPALAARADDAPKLALYPFATDGSAPAEAGAQFADALAADIRSVGGVSVVRGPAGLTPAQYHTDAQAQGADYFLIGAVAPVGSGFSIIEQLVRTRTGLLVWSATYQAASLDDVKGQGAQVRQALMDQIGHASFPAPRTTATAAPAAPLAAAAPAASASPASTFVVMSFGGTALPSDRAFAVRAVLENIRQRGATAAADLSVPADLQQAGAQACMDTGAATIVGGTLDITRPESLTAPPSTTAAVTLQVYDCRTQTLTTKPLTATKTTPIGTDAIRSAADAATAAYFGAPATHA
jgi:TolB-like protein